MTKLSGLAGALLLIFVFIGMSVAQADMARSQAPGILPSGYSDSVDRDVVKVREATAKFKTTEVAEAADTNASPIASNTSPTALWVITFRTMRCSTPHSTLNIRKFWFTRR